MIHLLFGPAAAAASLVFDRQIKKAKEAHSFIRETIHAERLELDELKNKYVGLLNEQKNAVLNRAYKDKEPSCTS